MPPRKAALKEANVRWKAGSRWKGSAKDAYEELERLRLHLGVSQLTPSHVFEAAQKARSPLRKFFVWDRAEAWERHNLDLARRLLGSFVVDITYEGGERTQIEELGLPDVVSTRGYVFDSTARGYVRSVEAFVDRDIRQRVVEGALRELNAFVGKYKGYTELTGIVLSIEEWIAATLPKSGAKLPRLAARKLRRRKKP